jgi:hypothetical protein
MTVCATDAVQFIKFPLLTSHYLEHKSVSQNLSFFDFLMMHYASDDNNDKDEERDMQLPFKVIHQSYFSLFSFSIHHNFKLSDIIICTQCQPFALSDEDTDYSHFISTIWQPPKNEHA